MESSHNRKVRDPVCDMIVSVNQQTPSVVFGQQTFYFCAPGCQAAFREAPERYLQPTAGKLRSALRQLAREAAIVAVVLILAVAVVAFARGRKTEPPPVAPGSSVTGAAAGQDQAVDNGAGSVIVSATFERNTSTDREAVFTVSLNTHSVDLTKFDPAAQMKLLTTNGQEGNVETAVANGDRSSHHQNYRVTFARPAAGSVTLVVKDVSGIAERRLNFQL